MALMPTIINGFYNISSKIDFQDAGLKVKITVAIFRKSLLWL